MGDTHDLNCVGDAQEADVIFDSGVEQDTRSLCTKSNSLVF